MVAEATDLPYKTFVILTLDHLDKIEVKFSLVCSQAYCVKEPQFS